MQRFWCCTRCRRHGATAGTGFEHAALCATAERADHRARVNAADSVHTGRDRHHRADCDFSDECHRQLRDLASSRERRSRGASAGGRDT
jgi:hypothetical protein